VTQDQAVDLKSMPSLTVTSGETTRIGFLILDARVIFTDNSPIKNGWLAWLTR